jgi:VWFA-related protein
MQSTSNSLLFSTLVLTLASISSAQDPQSSGITLKSSTQIVIVDVVVSGKDGNPVHGLKLSDFTLTENSTPETITHFEEHVAPTPAQLSAPVSQVKLPAGVFTNYSPAPTDGPLNVLLLDMLNTPLQDQEFVRKQLIKFLENSPHNGRIAIFSLTTRLFMLKSFTSDPDLLLAAVKDHKLNGRSPLLDEPIAGAPGQKPFELALGPLSGSSSGSSSDFGAVMSTAQTELRIKYTLDAMNQLALYLSGIPGRKNLMWFSGSFPINILPDTSGQLKDPFSGIASAEKEYRETTNLFTRSQVAVYPIDATGLYSAGMRSVVDASHHLDNQPQMPGSAGQAPRLSSFSQQLQDAEDRKTDNQQTMYRMAADTGGRAFVNTNDLATPVSQAIALGSNYYTLTYTPSDRNADGKYRKIQVKLPHDNYTLAYRHGYYAGDPNIPYRTTNTAAAPTRPYTPMQTAMLFGAPSATQIIFKIAIDHGASEEQSVAAGNKHVEKFKGPFHLYNVHYALNRDSIQFDDGPNGTHSGSFTFDAFLYNQDGDLVNTATSTINADLPIEAFNKLKTVGVQLALPISVPVKGDYYLRVGIHDLRSNRVGAVEVPIASIGDLSPAATASSAKTATVEPK